VTVPMVKATVLDFFCAQKENPLFQFLTWYLVLVERWKLEDIASVEMSPWREYAFTSQSMIFNFIFHNERRVSLTIVHNGEIYYAGASFELVNDFDENKAMANQPQHTPKGQINYNTGATPPKSVTSKLARNGTMKGMQHAKKLDAHNSKVGGC